MLDALLQGSCSNIAVCCYHRDAAHAEPGSGDHLQVRVTELSARSHNSVICCNVLLLEADQLW